FPYKTHLRSQKNSAVLRAGERRLNLCGEIPLQKTQSSGISAEFELKEGESQVFTLSDQIAGDDFPCPASKEEAQELFQQTVKYWHSWIGKCTYHGRWRERVERSALALKLLTYEPTGAIVAAATTSLPEVVGGPRNWDYRYTWMRDAAFTVYGFVRIGFTSEA